MMANIEQVELATGVKLPFVRQGKKEATVFSSNSNLHKCLDATAIGLALAFLVTPSAAQEQTPRKTEVAPFSHGVHAAPAAGATAYQDSEPPLFANLGRHSWKITTSNPQAQAFFDQGLRLAYGFNHAEARRAFRQAQRLDPSCAMCFWGEPSPLA
jgi:hypothetical protein